MERFDYLVVGASHAGLEAVRAIRAHDASGSIAMLNREPVLPYSPTVLPYVVSGRSKADRIALRDQNWFANLHTTYLQQASAAAVDTAKAVVRCADGKEIGYGKLLLATGAKPIIPPVQGLDGVPYHVLRTLDDALALRGAIGAAKHAVVLGAGLVGMHAAENLSKSKCQVTVVEMREQVLPGYFDAQAAAMIAGAFARNGVEVLTQHRVMSVARQGQGCHSVRYLRSHAVIAAQCVAVADDEEAHRGNMSFWCHRSAQRHDSRTKVKPQPNCAGAGQTR